MKHCMVTEIQETRHFVDICRRYSCRVTTRRYDKGRDVIIVECSLWTWLKILYWDWLDHSPELCEEIEGN